MSDDIFLLGVYRVLAFILGFLLFGMGLFFSFSGNLILLVITSLSLFNCSLNLKKNITNTKRKVGIVAGILGFVSYGFFVAESYIDIQRKIGLFDLMVLLVLALSVLLYSKIKLVK